MKELNFPPHSFELGGLAYQGCCPRLTQRAAAEQLTDSFTNSQRDWFVTRPHLLPVGRENLPGHTNFIRQK